MQLLVCNYLFFLNSKNLLLKQKKKMSGAFTNKMKVLFMNQNTMSLLEYLRFLSEFNVSPAILSEDEGAQIFCTIKGKKIPRETTKENFHDNLDFLEFVESLARIAAFMLDSKGLELNTGKGFNVFLHFIYFV